MIPYSFQTIYDDDIREVEKVLKSPFLTQGPKVKEFEEALKTKLKSKYVVAFSSGTSALLGLYFSLLYTKYKLFKSPKDFFYKKIFFFLTTPITFSATSNAAVFLGGLPLFVDVDENGNVSLDKLYTFLEILKRKAKNILKNIKFASFVHYAGNPFNTKKIYEILKEYNIPLLEDACHALGAKNENEVVGESKYSLGSAFSFHPVKPIACGEGGAVSTNDKKMYETLLLFRNHGLKKLSYWLYEKEFLSLNHRLSDIHAALGLSQLKKLEKFLEKRRRLAKIYYKLFKDIDFAKPIRQSNYSSYHLFPVRFKFKNLEKKKKYFENLRKKGIGVQVHYIPVYLLKFYKRLFKDFKEIYTKIYPSLDLKTFLKESYKFYKEELSIPLSQGLEEKDIYKIFDILISEYKKL